jgi:hypothetical protein
MDTAHSPSTARTVRSSSDTGSRSERPAAKISGF